jgi:hypothetical protein
MSINDEEARDALLSLQQKIGVIHNTATQI